MFSARRGREGGRRCLSPCLSLGVGFAPGWGERWLLRALLTASASLQVHREESIPGACGSQAVRNRTRHQTEQDEALMRRGWPQGILLPSVPQCWLGAASHRRTTKHRNRSLPKTQPVCLNVQVFPFTVIVWGGYLSVGRAHFKG